MSTFKEKIDLLLSLSNSYFEKDRSIVIDIIEDVAELKLIHSQYSIPPRIETPSCMACNDTKVVLLFGKHYACKNCKEFEH